MRMTWAGQIADALTSQVVALVLVAATLARFNAWVSVDVAVAAGVAMAVPPIVRAERFQRFAYLGITFALLAVWVVVFGAWSGLFGLVGWLIYLMRRLRYVGQDQALEQGPRLTWDLVYLAAAVLVGFLIHPSPDMLFLLLGSPLAALALRFVAMHHAEVTRVGALVNEGRQSATWPLWIFAGAATAVLVAAALFPGARTILLEILGAGALAFLLIRWWREWLVILLGGLGLAAAFYLLDHLLHRRKAQKSKIHVGKVGNLHILHHHVTHGGLPPFNWGLLAVIAAAIVILIVILRSRARDMDAYLTDAGLLVERTRLDPGKDRGTVGPTTPMRDLMRQWLRWERRRGRGIGLGETVRRFALRRGAVASEDEVARVKQAVDATARAYEHERYGEVQQPEEEVRRLNQVLREAGVFRRR